jgi:hypothetical protein
VNIADTTAPTAPANTLAKLVTTTKKRGKNVTTTTTVTISWSPSTDNVGVAQYVVYRNGSTLATLGGSSLNYTDGSTSAGGGTYTYDIRAIDAAQNQSPLGAASAISR